MNIIWKGSPNQDGNRKPIDRIVIHWFGMGTLQGAHNTFQKPGGTSAHYGISDDTIWQWVKEDRVAYHAGNYAMNQRSIGIEHDANPNKSLSEKSYQTSARLIKDICTRYNLPINRTTIIKHSEVPRATQCPGTIDLDKLINLAKGDMSKTITVNLSDWEKVLKNSGTLDVVSDFLGVPKDSDQNAYTGAIQKIMDERVRYLSERNSARKDLDQARDALKHCQDNPKVITIEKPVEIIKEVPVEVIKEVIIEKEVEKLVTADNIGALQLITLALKAMLRGSW